EAHLDRGTILNLNAARIVPTAYRPFTRPFCYYDRVIVHRLYQQNEIYPIGNKINNIAIGFSGISSSKQFQALSVDCVPSYDFLEKTQLLPRRRYTPSGERVDSGADSALKEFPGADGRAGRGAPKRAGAEVNEGASSPLEGEMSAKPTEGGE